MESTLNVAQHWKIPGVLIPQNSLKLCFGDSKMLFVINICWEQLPGSIQLPLNTHKNKLKSNQRESNDNTIYSSRLTYDWFGERSVFKRSQAKVANFDAACCPSDENVVTFQVSMYDGRRSRMEKLQTLENLAAPWL